MWRLSMSDGAALVSPELDAQDRAAAIAAMAARLAAARPRLRRAGAEENLPPRRETPTEADPLCGDTPCDCTVERVDVPRERLAKVSTPRPAAWRLHTGTLCSAALLAAMAGSGFGIVLLAQSPGVAAYIASLSRAQPSTNPAAANAAPPAADQAADQPPSLRHSMTASAEPASRRPMAMHRAAKTRLVAKASATPSPAAPRKVTLQAASLATTHREPLPALPRAEAADYRLPRWLTEPGAAKVQAAAAPETAPQPLVMSPPPHDLALPHAAPAATAPIAPAVKPRQPEMIFASSTDHPTAPFGLTATKPPFAPPYGPPYGAEGSYLYGPP